MPSNKVGISFDLPARLFSYVFIAAESGNVWFRPHRAISYESYPCSAHWYIFSASSSLDYKLLTVSSVNVIWIPCLLRSLQYPLINLLGFVQLTLVIIEYVESVKFPLHIIVRNHAAWHNMWTSSCMLETPSLGQPQLSRLPFSERAVPHELQEQASLDCNSRVDTTMKYHLNHNLSCENMSVYL